MVEERWAVLNLAIRSKKWNFFRNFVELCQSWVFAELKKIEIGFNNSLEKVNSYFIKAALSQNSNACMLLFLICRPCHIVVPLFWHQ